MGIYGTTAFRALSSHSLYQGTWRTPATASDRTIWDYGFGLDLLGFVIEGIRGEPLGTELIAPLRMVDTSFE
jgi:hypothetical protein